MEGITRLILPEAMALRNVIDKISPAYRSIPEPSFSKKQIFLIPLIGASLIRAIFFLKKQLNSIYLL